MIAILKRLLDHNNFCRFLEIIWVNGDWYTRAIQRLFALNNRNVSLVNCLSFEIMESREITHAFSFDKHLPEIGFAIDSFHDLDL